MDKELDKALARAKIGIMQKPDTIFFSTLCSSLKTSFTESIPTAGTDGTQIVINPKFFEKLTQEERIFLLAHESLHVAYMHVLRGESKDKRIFNMAADYVINLELKNRGFKFIEGGLCDAQYKDLSTEQVYNLLMEQAQNPPQSSSGGGSQSPDGKGEFALEGDLLPPDISTPEKRETLERQVQEIVQRAAMAAEMSNQAGSIPGDIKRALDKLAKPKINWKIVLSRFFHDLSKEDYSWRRLNKRFLPTFLPSLYSETMSRLDFAIDVSGSISEKQFTQFVSEVHHILRTINPSSVGVLQFDHILQDATEVRTISEAKNIQFKGGGGTQPQAALDYFTTSPAIGLVVLTDGYFNTNLRDPRKPVIWVVYDNEKFKAPFGTTVHFDLKEQYGN